MDASQGLSKCENDGVVGRVRPAREVMPPPPELASAEATLRSEK
jgi:hypothetical protein